MSAVNSVSGRRCGVTVALYLLLAATASTSVWAADRHALMVAVSRPIAIADAEQLDGVHNDLVAMRQLAERWGVPPQRLTVLQSGGAVEPTYAAVRRAMQALLQRLRRGDEVLIYLTGHGSQQPVLASKPDEDEDDGLDEVFLLADTRPLPGPLSRFENALVDNEMGAWMDAASARGAFVWLVVDACHAGTFERGATLSTTAADEEFDVSAVKRVPMTVLGLPYPLTRKIDAQHKRWLGGRKRHTADVVTTKKSAAMPAAQHGVSADSQTLDDPAFVGFYAVQAGGNAEEVRNRRTGMKYSLFSSVLVKTFDAAVARKGAGAVSFEQLAKAVYTQYGQFRRSYPLPEFIGTDWSRPVLPPVSKP